MASLTSKTPASIRKMTMKEKFFFDLNGYIIIRGALQSVEVDDMNKAIDAHISEV